MTPTLAIIKGGLGFSQLGALTAALASQLPSLTIWTPGGQNQYQVSEWPQIAAHPNHRIVLLEHSLACDYAIDCAAALAAKGTPAAYLGIIEKVWFDKVAPVCDAWDWYQCDAIFDFPRGKIAGWEPQIISETGHNSICQDPGVIEQIVARVKAVLEAA